MGFLRVIYIGPRNKAGLLMPILGARHLRPGEGDNHLCDP